MFLCSTHEPVFVTCSHGCCLEDFVHQWRAVTASTSFVLPCSSFASVSTGHRTELQECHVAWLCRRLRIFCRRVVPVAALRRCRRFLSWSRPLVMSLGVQALRSGLASRWALLLAPSTASDWLSAMGAGVSSLSDSGARAGTTQTALVTIGRLAGHPREIGD